MKVRTIIQICIFSVFFGFACQPAADEDQYVIIISIDGFPAWALTDENLSLPAIRMLADEGSSAEALIPSNPTVTWPNHTTLVTGTHPEKHGVLLNGLLVRSESDGTVHRDPDRDRHELVSPDVQTLYDIAHSAGLRTAEINWPATRNAETIDDGLPDAPYSVRHMTPQLRDELVDLGLLGEEELESGSPSGYGPKRDHVRTRAAAHLIRNRQPHLLLLHLLNVDSSHHRYGVDSHAGYSALALADAHVAEILLALDDAGIRDQTAIFIVSDHGFINVENDMFPNVLLRQHGLLQVNEDNQITSARVQSLSVSGAAMIYATHPETRQSDIQKAKVIFEDLEGIAVILEPDQYREYGLPHPDDNPGMGDLFLAAETGYGFNNNTDRAGFLEIRDQPRGAHGFLNTNPLMETIFIASGKGIRRGVELGNVDNRSIAPTAAALLGLTLETADVEKLDSILLE